MRLTVIGASKGIGLETVKYGVERGHDIRAVARSADKIALDAPNLEKMVGDATDPQDLQKAIDGAEAVILTLGVPRDIRVLKFTTLFSAATQALIPAMEAAGIRRLIAVTGFGAGESYDWLSSVEKLGRNVFLGRAYADKAIQEDLIKGSSLDWTIARPGILTNTARTGKYQVLVEPDTWRQGLISRADVGHYLITAAETGSHIHKTPATQR